uniref:Large envelope protein n=1 Tax=Stork hepatitis B virus TaxID=110944 RepID=Q8UYX6_HHBV|nr:preS/surface antigen [Stork hepatitis B virus]
MGHTQAKSTTDRRVEGGELLLQQLAGRMIPREFQGPITTAGKLPSIDHVMDHIDSVEELRTMQNQGHWPEGTGRRLGLDKPTTTPPPAITWTREEDERAKQFFKQYQENRPKQPNTAPPPLPELHAADPPQWKIKPGDPLLQAQSLIPKKDPDVPILKLPQLPKYKKKVGASFGGILAGLIGLLVGFFLLTKILEILRKLDWWWISLSSPKEKMLCAFQSTGHQTSPHYVGSCPWGCPGFLWTYLRLSIIFLLILLVAAGLLFLTENKSIIFEKLQWESVSALFSSIYLLLPSEPKSLVALTFGLFLIWTTSSSVTQVLVTLTQLATLSALFFKNSA